MHRAFRWLIHLGTSWSHFRDAVIYGRLQWFLAESSALCSQSPPHLNAPPPPYRVRVEGETVPGAVSESKPSSSAPSPPLDHFAGAAQSNLKEPAAGWMTERNPDLLKYPACVHP